MEAIMKILSNKKENGFPENFYWWNWKPYLWTLKFEFGIISRVTKYDSSIHFFSQTILNHSMQIE